MTCNMFSESGEVVGLDVRRFPSCLVSLTTKLRRHENSSDRLDEHQQSTMHMYIYIYIYIYIISDCIYIYISNNIWCTESTGYFCAVDVVGYTINILHLEISLTALVIKGGWDHLPGN